MIATLVLQAALGAIGPQQLPATGCAAYLWSTGEPRRLVAMAEPARLRLQLDGRTVDLARSGAEGVAGLGLARSTVYTGQGMNVTLDLTVVERADLTQGGLAPEATLTVQPAGGDATVTPLAGMVGCR